DDETEARIEKARKEFLQNRYPTHKAAALANNVPYHTFVRRMKGTAFPKKRAHDNQALLNWSEKKALVEWVKYLGLTGHPVNKRTIRPKVQA
ncbi:hypothetical protein EV368DRAFT_24560, partial [Lentinula lateritia]